MFSSAFIKPSRDANPREGTGDFLAEKTARTVRCVCDREFNSKSNTGTLSFTRNLSDLVLSSGEVYRVCDV